MACGACAPPFCSAPCRPGSPFGQLGHSTPLCSFDVRRLPSSSGVVAFQIWSGPGFLVRSANRNLTRRCVLDKVHRHIETETRIVRKEGLAPDPGLCLRNPVDDAMCVNCQLRFRVSARHANYRSFIGWQLACSSRIHERC